MVEPSPQLLLALAQDHIEGVAAAAVELAQHRKSDTVELQDLQLCLGEANTYIPVRASMRCVRVHMVDMAAGLRVEPQSYPRCIAVCRKFEGNGYIEEVLGSFEVCLVHRCIA